MLGKIYAHVKTHTNIHTHTPDRFNKRKVE